MAKMNEPVVNTNPAVIPEDETEEHRFERRKRLARQVVESSDSDLDGVSEHDISDY
eukprot:CAMPEP_0198224868 /NCGR_PEP_ID=MMETSP1445-20131203/98615_1 /TAXON_ID=36898 /ORGANISM="Pyramimonas sp., Strain CCMP2087" /LENGTH=55 /DNA_ID=CAMNT_0043904177 /DNA_START=9 /DNA_END=173 /DNA_ORIENTATION=+